MKKEKTKKMIDKIVKEIRNFEGVVRKKPIGSFVEEFIDNPSDVITSFGEDAAVVEVGDEILLLAADGIWSKLMDADPQWAGYCSVLVNVHDIVAMGGEPVAIVDVLTTCSEDIYENLTKGMNRALDKLDVPLVGGHTKPDCKFNSIDVAILGKVEKGQVLFSDTAKPGQAIIYATDLEGRVHPSFKFNWDSTTCREKKVVLKQMKSIPRLSKKNLISSGKDISNPGLLGTLAMLLESSEKGATVDLNNLIKPNSIDMIDWLKMYPGAGFVVTADQDKKEEVKDVFLNHELSPCEIGEINEGNRLKIKYKGDERTLFDLGKENLTGI